MFKRGTKWFALILSLVLVFSSLSACGDNGTSSGNTSTGSTNGEKLVFGYSAPTLSHGWHVINRDYIQYACDQLGVDLIVTDAQADDQKQISDVQSLLQQNIDGLLICPNVGSIGVRILELCKEAGVPVVFMDREPEAEVNDWTGTYISYVGPDGEEAGYRVGKYLFEECGVKKLLEIDGQSGASSALERATGLQRALEEHPDVELLAAQPGDWEMDKGMNVAQDLLAAHPDADGIWAANDMMGMGALSAVEAENLQDQVSIASMDVDPELVKMMTGGHDALKFTAGAHYICGAISAISLYDHLNGVSVESRIYFKMLGVPSAEAQKFLDLYDENALLEGKITTMSKYLNPNAADDRFSNILSLD